jgi:hypothetical protein
VHVDEETRSAVCAAEPPGIEFRVEQPRVEE